MLTASGVLSPGSEVWRGPVDDGEQCDDGNDFNGDGCNEVCEVELFCGDGVTSTGEPCDWSEPAKSDGGTLECTVVDCGNNLVESGEECDDGADGDPADGCRDACTVPRCGDGAGDTFRMSSATTATGRAVTAAALTVRTQ